jgi:hypothetical protein
LVGAVEDKTSNVEITDFSVGEDVLEIDGHAIDFEDLPEGILLSEDGDGNAVLSFADDETVTMLGTQVGTSKSESNVEMTSFLDLGDGTSIPIIPFDEENDVYLPSEDETEDLMEIF